MTASTKPRDVDQLLATLRERGLEDVARAICAEERVWLRHVLIMSNSPSVRRARRRIFHYLVDEMGMTQTAVAELFRVHRNSVVRAVGRERRREAEVGMAAEASGR